MQIAAVVPEAVSVGGNTGAVNTFAGADLGNITGGAYQTSDLTNPTLWTPVVLKLVSQASENRRIRWPSMLMCDSLANYNDAFAAQFPGAAVGQP